MFPAPTWSKPLHHAKSMCACIDWGLQVYQMHLHRLGFHKFITNSRDIYWALMCSKQCHRGCGRKFPNLRGLLSRPANLLAGLVPAPPLALSLPSSRLLTSSPLKLCIGIKLDVRYGTVWKSWGRSWLMLLVIIMMCEIRWAKHLKCLELWVLTPVVTLFCH